MSEPSYEVKIPNIMNPFTVEVNGKTYSFPAGTTQMVNRAVYDVIRNIESMVPTPNPRAGEPSFESLRDRPFGESTEVLFDQRVEFTEIEGKTLYTGKFPELPEVGKTYTVTYNGTVYNCAALDIDGMRFIGNAVVADMDNTGEPFAIGVIKNGVEGDGVTDMFMFPLDGSTSATVKIEKTVIHTIDPKFLTGVLLYADKSGYLYKSDVLSEENEVSMDEVLGYAKKGMTVVVTPYAIGERTDYHYATVIIKITTEEPNYARVLAGGDSYYHSKERVVNAAPPV